MYTKSLIQQQVELTEAKATFHEDIDIILEKYDVKDSVLGMNNNHHAVELVNGYFTPVATFESLNEAIKNMSSYTQAIRIKENKEFILGDVFKSLVLCEGREHVYDIAFMSDVY